MEIKRIRNINKKLIEQVNQIFDDKKWNKKQGKLFLSDKNSLFLLAFIHNTRYLNSASFPHPMPLDSLHQPPQSLVCV